VKKTKKTSRKKKEKTGTPKTFTGTKKQEYGGVKVEGRKNGKKKSVAKKQHKRGSSEEATKGERKPKNERAPLLGHTVRKEGQGQILKKSPRK